MQLLTRPLHVLKTAQLNQKRKRQGKRGKKERKKVPSGARGPRHGHAPAGDSPTNTRREGPTGPAAPGEGHTTPAVPAKGRGQSPEPSPGWWGPARRGRPSRAFIGAATAAPRAQSLPARGRGVRGSACPVSAAP